jgi:hypothetical protein
MTRRLSGSGFLSTALTGFDMLRIPINSSYPLVRAHEEHVDTQHSFRQWLSDCGAGSGTSTPSLA